MNAPAPKLSVIESVETQRDDLVSLVRRRISGTYELDRWGLDLDAVHVACRIAALRWSAVLSGVEHVPAEGPALLVANRRLGWSEPAVVAATLSVHTNRVIRPAGGMDFDPIGGLARRLGAIPARPAEVAAALRAGNVVLAPTRREPVRNRAGHVPIELLATAVALGVPIVPVAVVGREFGRRWTVRVAEPVGSAEAGLGEVGSSARAGRKGSGGSVARAKAGSSTGARAKSSGAADARGARSASSGRAGVPTRDDARVVGIAAVEVAAVLDAMLADESYHGLGHRVVAWLPGDGVGAAGRAAAGGADGDVVDPDVWSDVDSGGVSVTVTDADRTVRRPGSPVRGATGSARGATSSGRGATGSVRGATSPTSRASGSARGTTGSARGTAGSAGSGPKNEKGA